MLYRDLLCFGFKKNEIGKEFLLICFIEMLVRKFQYLFRYDSSHYIIVTSGVNCKLNAAATRQLIIVIDIELILNIAF